MTYTNRRAARDEARKMSNKHTPGPWTVDDDENIMAMDGALAIAVIMLAEDFPCISGDDDGEARERLQIECEANADLIAAAPDLLAALQGLMAFAPAASLTAGPELSAWIAARAAIARATGE